MGDRELARRPLCACGEEVVLALPGSGLAARNACPACREPYSVDDLGILRLAATDRSWRDLPHHVVAAVLAASTAEALVQEMLDGEAPWPSALRRRLMHPSGGGAATLVAIQPGARVLDLTGWPTLPRALRSFGANVAVGDWVYARLRFAALLQDGTPDAVHLSPDAALPWTAGTFDAVFVDVSELESAAGIRGRDRLLREVRRVLRAEGVAVLGTRNGLRHLLERPRGAGVGLAELVRSVVRPAQKDVVRRCGLEVTRTVVPMPRRVGWRALVPGERLADHLRESLTGTSTPRAAAARGAARLLVRLGGARWVAADHYLIAQHRGAVTPTLTLAELVLADETARASTGRRAEIHALSDARVAVAGEHHFVKLPLTAEQQEKLAAEVAKTEAARRTAFAPFVLSGARVERRHGLVYAVYPRVPVVHDPARQHAAVELALGRLGVGVAGPLSSTAFWGRLATDRGARDAAEIGAGRLRTLVLDAWADRVVPVGASHGDLHSGNVLLRADGPPLLVDWNRFEIRNPLLLDGVYAVVEACRDASGGTLASALEAFVDDEIGGPLARRARTLLGDLAPLEAAVVVLLDRAMSYGQPRRRHRPWTLPPLQLARATLDRRMMTVPEDRAGDRREA
ncbi:hypothetical protein FE374_04070 [Georgenia yuyongxinii]|uniref:Uncharacterized protein n=1 Tax=Georgenia yuyongxinii TaxID=2589797 RepID=A0A5B8C0F2_9MICO|nr:phosphotransferase [Georgenia yuyongxinii]QDC23918.1 hypothetical protein FE374_04070 [Georgenia yuyongxinii]